MFIKGATLLSTEEATTFLTREEREFKGWWWLRSPGYFRDRAAYVFFGGSVFYRGFLVDTDDGCVRPALIIDLTSSDYKVGETFVFGDKTFNIISDNLAFCLEDIGKYYFRRDRKAEDANDYEASDVKKFVDAWFEAAMQDYADKEREDEYQERAYEYDYLQMASEIDGSL